MSLFPFLALVALPANAAEIPPGPAAATAGVLDLLAVRPVTFEAPHPYPWRRDHPPLTDGLLLVLEVDPGLARPRQVGEPVLYVGDTPAERLNPGWPSGRLLVLVPGDVDPAVDPIWFGSPELPERVDARRGAAELAAARARGFAPFAPEVVARARQAGGDPLRVEDSTAFYRGAAGVLEAWIPEEAERAENLRAPLVPAPGE